jgi:CRP-like cAMP-binding protein
MVPLQIDSSQLLSVLALVLLLSLTIAIFWKREKKAPQNSRVPKKSYDDDLINGRRSTKSVISRKLAQSMRWLKDRAKTMLPSSKSRGDGLRSIFTHVSSTAFDSAHHLDDSYTRLVCDPEFNETQQFTFSALHESGIFEGAEISVLNDVCEHATLFHLSKSDILFSENDTCEYLYILKTGQCDVLFPEDDDEGTSVHSMGPKSVVASHVDVIAWISGCKITRQVSVKCSEDCQIIKIPSPTRDGGSFKTRLHLTTYSRIVRMLLARINRTTVTTSLFYLGLADNFLPAFRLVHVPSHLSEVCSSSACIEDVKKALAIRKSTEMKSERGDYKRPDELLPLVRECIYELCGLSGDHVDVQVAVDLSGPSVPSAKDESAKEESSGPKAGDSVPKALKRDDSDTDDEAELREYFPPIRAKSFDSTFQPLLGSPGGLNVSEPFSTRGATKKINSKLLMLKRGQSITDIEEVPGLYIVISGSLKLQFCGRYRNTKQAPVVGTWRKAGHSAMISTGSVLGHIALLSGTSEEWYGSKGGSTALMTVSAESECCWLLSVSVDAALAEVLNRPLVMLHISTRLIEALPPVLRLFDFCTKWKKVEGGDVVVSRGQPPTGELLVVLCGRLGIGDSQGSDKRSGMCSYRPFSEEFHQCAVGVKEGDTDTDYVLGKGALIGICFIYSFMLQFMLYTV